MLESIQKLFSENGTQIIFFTVAFAVFYVFFIRPKQKEEGKKEDFVKSIKKGTKIVTIGGLHGTVADVGEKSLVLNIDRKGSQITIAKEAVSIPASKQVQ